MYVFQDGARWKMATRKLHDAFWGKPSGSKQYTTWHKETRSLEAEMVEYLRERLAKKHPLWKGREVEMITAHPNDDRNLEGCWSWRSNLVSVELESEGPTLHEMHMAAARNGVSGLSAADGKRYMQCHARMRKVLEEHCDDAAFMVDKRLRPGQRLVLRVWVVPGKTTRMRLFAYAPGAPTEHL